MGLPAHLTSALFSLPALILVAARLSGLFLAAPILASSVIPRKIKALMIFGLAVLLTPAVARYMPEDLHFSVAVAGMVGEVAIGAAMGIVLLIAASAAECAGVVVGQQAGLALGQVFDPNLDEETTVISQFYTIAFMSVFLSVGGLRETVAALLESYERLPMLTAWPDPSSAAQLLAEIATASLSIGIRLGGTALLVLFLLTLAMGLVSRTMPQLNILSVGFNLRATAMMGACAFGLIHAGPVILGMIDQALDAIRKVEALQGGT